MRIPAPNLEIPNFENRIAFAVVSPDSDGAFIIGRSVYIQQFLRKAKFRSKQVRLQCAAEILNRMISFSQLSFNYPLGRPWDNNWKSRTKRSLQEARLNSIARTLDKLLQQLRRNQWHVTRQKEGGFKSEP